MTEGGARRSPFDLSGRAAVVTGGNDGIGLAIARALGVAGARVALWGRRPEANEEACRRLLAEGITAAPVVCDVADEQSVDRAFSATIDAFGAVDVCFANAGIGGPSGSFLDLDPAGLDAVLAVNVRGVVLAFRAVARHLVARREGGVLVATASAAALVGEPRRAAYAASKGALVGLVRSLAVELAPHRIRVHALAPGLVQTEMTAGAVEDPTFRRAALGRIPARRFGAPDDLGAVAVFLASDGSAWSTGQVLVVDGGRSIS